MAGRPRPWLTVVGDAAERSNFGQELSRSPGGAGSPPALIIGAPTSYRTGTWNGTAFALPLAFRSPGAGDQSVAMRGEQFRRGLGR